MNFEDIFIKVDGIEGWMGKADCEALYKHVSQLENVLIVEIGSYKGRSTFLMALASPSSEIISIDIKDQCSEIMKGKKWSIIEDKSQNVGKNWTRPIDFLFIDGDHTYEAVKEDIELFSSHVVKGNYVFLHDYVVKGDPVRIIVNKKYFDSNPYYDKEYGIVHAVEETKDKYFDEVKIVSGFACCRKK